MQTSEVSSILDFKSDFEASMPEVRKMLDTCDTCPNEKYSKVVEDSDGGPVTVQRHGHSSICYTGDGGRESKLRILGCGATHFTVLRYFKRLVYTNGVSPDRGQRSHVSGTLSQTMAAMPTFAATPHDTTAMASTAHGGLELLVDNLLANTQPVDQAPLPKVAATPVAVVPAGAGPAASLSTKKILALEFVEMSEITVDPDMPKVPGRPPFPARPPITDGRLAHTQLLSTPSGTGARCPRAHGGVHTSPSQGLGREVSRIRQALA